MKAVILARVSSKEQEEGHSIEAQIQRLQEYCQRKDLSVLKTFKIVESSTKGDRKEFKNMIDFCKRQNETVAIVSDAVDRIQRSFKESILLDDPIRRGKIELHFYRENMVIGQNASSSDIMRWDFSVMGAKHYILSMVENVKRSMDLKKKSGEICGPAPIGYLNAKDKNGKSSVIVDPERGHLIKKIFEEYATGLYSIRQMVEKATEWGLRSTYGNPVSKSSMSLFLQNPFYYGEMKIKGKLYPHKYETLITRRTFDKCQDIIFNRNTNKSSQTKYGEKEYLFRGLIKCGNCGYTISTDTKTKKSGKKYTYLYCSHVKGHCGESRTTEDEALEQVAKVLKSFTLPDNLLKEIKAHLKNSADAKKEFHNKQISLIQGRYTKAQQKKDNLLDLRIEGELDKTVYEKKRQEIDNEIQKLKGELDNYEQADEKFSTTLSLLLDLASNAYKVFMSSEIDVKRQLVNLIFTNLSLTGKNLSFSIRKPFDGMVKWAKRPDWLGD